MAHLEQLAQLDVETRLAMIDEIWDSIASDPAAAAQVPLSDAARSFIDARLQDHRDHRDDVVARDVVRDELFAKP